MTLRIRWHDHFQYEIKAAVTMFTDPLVCVVPRTHSQLGARLATAERHLPWLDRPVDGVRLVADHAKTKLNPPIPHGWGSIGLQDEPGAGVASVIR